MVIRHTELKKMEQLYEKNGNQLVLLYGREGGVDPNFLQREKILLLSCAQSIHAGAVYAVRTGDRKAV